MWRIIIFNFCKMKNFVHQKTILVLIFFKWMLISHQPFLFSIFLYCLLDSKVDNQLFLRPCYIQTILWEYLRNKPNLQKFEYIKFWKRIDVIASKVQAWIWVCFELVFVIFFFDDFMRLHPSIFTSCSLWEMHMQAIVIYYRYNLKHRFSIHF